jgi:hypothetical protein
MSKISNNIKPNVKEFLLFFATPVVVFFSLGYLLILNNVLESNDLLIIGSVVTPVLLGLYQLGHSARRRLMDTKAKALVEAADTVYLLVMNALKPSEPGIELENFTDTELTVKARRAHVGLLAYVSNPDIVKNFLIIALNEDSSDMHAAYVSFFNGLREELGLNKVEISDPKRMYIGKIESYSG